MTSSPNDPAAGPPTGRVPSLSQRVYDGVTERIRNGELKPGMKVPTEPVLMREFGVSRSVVREAVSRLQANGLVRTRHGVGSFVLTPPTASPLTEPAMIAALVRAAQAGATIDLIVRGACMLPPGIPGQTERIRVRSVVGRFLEHTRVLYFRWGDTDADEALYLSSADWMGRNMFRRIELAWPVRDPRLRQRVIDECLVPYLHDGCDAWLQAPDGSYTRASGGPSAQAALAARYMLPTD